MSYRLTQGWILSDLKSLRNLNKRVDVEGCLRNDLHSFQLPNTKILNSHSGFQTQILFRSHNLVENILDEKRKFPDIAGMVQQREWILRSKKSNFYPVSVTINHGEGRHHASYLWSSSCNVSNWLCVVFCSILGMSKNVKPNWTSIEPRASDM